MTDNFLSKVCRTSLPGPVLVSADVAFQILSVLPTISNATLYFGQQTDPVFFLLHIFCILLFYQPLTNT
jgi:hypothetical protein